VAEAATEVAAGGAYRSPADIDIIFSDLFTRWAAPLIWPGVFSLEMIIIVPLISRIFLFLVIIL
jgi:hypothetical protein